MRHNLLTFILLATILVEVWCIPNRPQNRRRIEGSPRRVENTSPGSCIIPKFTTGVRIVRSSCGRSCNSKAGQSVPSGTRLTYNCRNGYMIMNGSGMTVCSEGAWDETPRCWKTCDALVSDSVDIVCRLWGEVVPCQPHVPPGTVASLHCTWPYLFPFAEGDGYREINCLSNGTWNRSLFTCALAF